MLDLLKQLSLFAKEEFKEEMYHIIPKLLSIIESQKLTNEEVTEKSLDTVRELKPDLLDDYLYIIVPSILRICCSGQINVKQNLKESSLKVLSTLVHCNHFKEYIA
jgi:hypothetical protein